MDDVASQCIAIIAAQKKIAPETVTLDSTFEELNMDSLDKINASFEVEDLFDVAIPDDAIGGIRTVRDMVEGVVRLIEQKSAEQTVVEENK